MVGQLRVWVAFFLVFALFSLFLVKSTGQFGEIAGQPHLEVNIGGSNSTNVTLDNTGTTPLSFRTILPTFKNYGNTTPPVVTVTPMNATIPPESLFRVEITAYVPSHNNSIGDNWVGYIQFVEVTNNTNPGGAVIEAGLIKILTVTAIPSVFSPVPYIIAVIIIAAIAGVAYYMYKKKATKKAAKKGARKAVGRAIKGGRRAKGRKVAKKKATRKAKGGRRTTRRARR